MMKRILCMIVALISVLCTSVVSASATRYSALDTATGQETTVLFIMLGVMVAAVVLIIIMRKMNRK